MSSPHRTQRYHDCRLLEQRNRRWLRGLIESAVRCSLASSLALPACAISEPEPERAAVGAADMMSGQPLEPPSAGAGTAGAAGARGAAAAAGAGGSTPDGAACAGGVWELAPHLTLARDVDYVADRLDSRAVVSEKGSACATALDPDACNAALHAPLLGLGRHLVTTAGDSVDTWGVATAVPLLAPIERAEEAIWLALARGYSVQCGARIVSSDRAGGYFLVEAQRTQETCSGSETVQATVRVGHDGKVTETIMSVTGGLGCPGRRPEGLWAQQGEQTGAGAGERFAEMARMEAASVPAFVAIAEELRCHRAPCHLLREARRAVGDEMRHARTMAQLARRFGGAALPALVTPTPPRSLVECAIDNAVEGCVHETFAAALARDQAERAREPIVRSALHAIADDEARHAALSWAIAAWAEPRLDPASRRRARDARQGAVDALGAEIEARSEDRAPELARAGFADVQAEHALYGALRRTLWCAPGAGLHA